MKAEQIKKFIYFNNIKIGNFVTFQGDLNRYTLTAFKKEDKVLVDDVESGEQKLKKIEDIETSNNKPVRKKNETNFDGGIVVYGKGENVYILNLDKEKDGRVHFKSSPAYKVVNKENNKFGFIPIDNVPNSYNVNMLPGFVAKEKDIHGQLEIPGMERRSAKGGYPSLFNVTKNIHSIQDLIDNAEFFNWFKGNRKTLKEYIDYNDDGNPEFETTSLIGHVYHGTVINLEEGDGLYSKLRVGQSDWDAVWVSDQEKIAEEFSENKSYDEEKGIFVVYMLEANCHDIAYIDYDDSKEIVDSFVVDDFREVFSMLDRLGYNGCKTLGSIGSTIYEDYAIFDENCLEIIAAKFKVEDEWTDYMSIIEAEEFLEKQKENINEDKTFDRVGIDREYGYYTECDKLCREIGGLEAKNIMIEDAVEVS